MIVKVPERCLATRMARWWRTLVAHRRRRRYTRAVRVCGPIASLALLVFSSPTDYAAEPSEYESLPWRPILWTGSGRGSRAVLDVSARLDGINAELSMQLDSANPITQLYADPYRIFGIKRPERVATTDRRPLTGEISGCWFRAHIPVIPRAIRGDRSGPIQIGCLGSDFFARRILLLDFVTQRIAILPEHTELPVQVEQETKFLPMAVRRGQWYIPVEVNGLRNYGFLFDSGSSLSTLITTRTRWQRLTGRMGDEPDNRKRVSGTWGKRSEFVGAPLKGNFRIGSAILEKPIIEFESTGLPNFDFDRYPAQGLFGNVIFFDRFTLVIDVLGHRFGLIDHRKEHRT